ncbi:MAG: hypothetical protein U0V72_02375 [Cytophagales bacterium]
MEQKNSYQEIIQIFKEFSINGNSNTELDTRIFEEVNNFIAFHSEYELFENVSASQIVFFLKRTHSYFLNKKLPEIEQAIGWSYGNDVFSIFIQDFFTKMKTDLLEHIIMEEKKLFPYILYLENGIENRLIQDLLEKGYCIDQYESEHNDQVEAEINKVKETILKTKDKAHNPLAYQLLINKLDTLELELRLHALIEDEILIPKVIELEKI